MQKLLKRSIKKTEFFVAIIIIALSIAIQAKSGLFFSNNNIVDLLRSMIIPSIYALCALLSFVSTGPDVSFPLIAALSTYLSLTVTNNFGLENAPWIVVFLIAIVFGCLMGAVNGYIIVKYRFPSLIVTLGTTSLFSGLLLGAFEAQRMDLPANLAGFGGQTLLEVTNKTTGLGSKLPMTFAIMVVLYILAYVVLNWTMVGRGVYAVGGDEVSAERAGFNVKAIRFGVFVVNGGIAAVAGVCYAAMSMRFLPTEYSGAEMIVIAAIILGGTKMTGGSGSLTGCILGTLLLTMVTNSLIMIGIPVNWKYVFIGLIIIAGTAISAIDSSKKKAKKAEKETV